jgi:uncharacterized protein (TIGR00297 family)
MSMFDLARFSLSLILSIVAGGLSYWRGLLSESGWAGAVVVGTLTAGVGGWEWGLLLILFFASSSALSRFGARRKQQFVAEQWEKGDRRDWGQVFANGGLFALLALAWAFSQSELAWAAALGILATSTGDTWATELGVLSRRAPRLITTGRSVAAGTSGGITLLGSLAALAGAACIGIAGVVLRWLLQHDLRLWMLPAAIAGGVTGVAMDSLLGATVQAMYWCPRCGKETERRLHACGTHTVHLRGWPWLANDAVNAVSSLAGGAMAAGTAAWLIFI